MCATAPHAPPTSARDLICFTNKLSHVCGGVRGFWEEEDVCGIRERSELCCLPASGKWLRFKQKL